MRQELLRQPNPLRSSAYLRVPIDLLKVKSVIVTRPRCRMTWLFLKEIRKHSAVIGLLRAYTDDAWFDPMTTVLFVTVISLRTWAQQLSFIDPSPGLPDFIKGPWCSCHME